MKENIIKCSTCRKTVIAEEEFTHECTFDAIDIPVSSFFSVKIEDHESVIGFGLNGKSYRFVKRLSPEVKRGKDSPEDETEPKIGRDTRIGLFPQCFLITANTLKGSQAKITTVIRRVDKGTVMYSSRPSFGLARVSLTPFRSFRCESMLHIIEI